MKKVLNYAPLVALIASGVAMAAPAGAKSLELSPTSIKASHELLGANSLQSEVASLRPVSNQQQQQQQQRRSSAVLAGLVYGSPETGFNV